MSDKNDPTTYIFEGANVLSRNKLHGKISTINDMF
jgi:hypothetical protein